MKSVRYMNNDEVIQLFEIYLSSVRRYSNHIVSSYLEDVKTLTNFLAREEFGSLLDVSPRTARFFVATLHEEYARATIARKISTLRSFYHFLVREDIIKDHPFLDVELPKKEKRLPKFIYPEEMEALINSIDRTTPLGERNFTIVEMLYGTGLRASELVGVNVSDLDFYDDFVLVHGKGSKDRYVPIHKRLKRGLQNYILTARDALKKEDQKALFLNHHGERLTDRGLRYVIHDLIEKSSTMLSMSPHTFRHTFATHLINNGADLRSVQELLGHSSISSTQIYTGVSKEVLQQKYMDAHPRAKRTKDE